MNRYLKTGLSRGLIFGGFGPIIYSIVIYIISFYIDEFIISAGDILLGVVSTYVITFVQACSTVLNQIENWSSAKSLFWHFLTLYSVYSVAYVVNSWIPFDPKMLLVFTLVFAAIYFVIWFTVYITVRSVEKKLNKKLG